MYVPEISAREHVVKTAKAISDSDPRYMSDEDNTEQLIGLKSAKGLHSQ
jgi:hypothetical protein